MDEALREAARRAPGFMPEPEGLALYSAAVEAAPLGPLLEIGSYCGKSSIYLGAAARERGTVLFSIDHHRGSEEHQIGEQYHDPRFLDRRGRRMDTLFAFRRTIEDAGLEDVVIGIVGASHAVAAHWRTPLGLAFIDGGHSERAAHDDYEGWAPHVAPGGLLVIHDVFDDRSEGGSAPFDVYRRALDSGRYLEVGREASLRALRRAGGGH